MVRLGEVIKNTHFNVGSLIYSNESHLFYSVLHILFGNYIPKNKLFDVKNVVEKKHTFPFKYSASMK